MAWRRRAILRRAAAAGSMASVAGCLGDGVDSAAELRSAAEVFDHLRELPRTMSAGFRSRSTYVETADGALGEVFVHERAHEITDPADLDPHRPTAAFYRLLDDGGYEPIGVGWAIHEANVDGTPELFGRDFHDPEDHHVPGQDSHYGLHAWVFDEGIDDLFRPTHPSLVAPSFLDALHDARSALGDFRMSEDQAGADVAADAGYENTQEHIFTDDGLYGVPFYNPDVDGIDPDRPPILLYRMTDMWYYELMGAEWFVPTADATEPPTMFEQPFHDALAGHSPHTDQPEHYGIHAWLFRANPNGMFSLYNPQLD